MEWEDELGAALESAIQELPESLSVLFSGGLDSSLLAHLSIEKGKRVQLYACGTDDSHDSIWAPKAADILGLPLKFLSYRGDEIVGAIRMLKELTDEESPLLILIELPLFFVTLNSLGSVIVSGQGADELFLGYKKYERENTSVEDVRRVLDHVLPMEMKIANAHGKEMAYPYLHRKVVEIATRIPYGLSIQNGSRKYVLRSTASKLNLNSELAWKPKKASQYSSGFKDEVARIAKEKNKTVHEFISEL